MIRLLVYLAIATVFALAVSWLADQDGQTVIVWQGMRIELATSLAVGGLIGFGCTVGILLWLIRRILGWPGLISHNWQKRRRQEGEKALALGMVAFAAGDIKGARRQAKKSHRLLGSGILPELLSAQAAHAAGDMRAAKRYFQSLSKVKQTAYFGYIGLMRLHHAEGNFEDASEAAQQALGLEKQSLPALTKLLADDLNAEDWQGAHHKTDQLIQLTRTEKNEKDGLFSQSQDVDNTLLPHGQLADLSLLAAHLCVFTAESEPEHQQPFWLKKALHYQAPILEPALRLAELEASRSTKAAQKILENTYRYLPHITLADQLRAYTAHNDGQHVAYLTRLAEKNQHPDMAQLVVAHAAWQAGIWAAASAALAAISERGQNNDYFLLQAKIAQALTEAGLADNGLADNGQTDKVLNKEQALMQAAHAHHGPDWHCFGCGQASGKWAAICGNCGVVGQIGWQSTTLVESDEKKRLK